MSTDNIVTTRCTRGLWDWSLDGPDGHGHYVTGNEPQAEDLDKEPVYHLVWSGVATSIGVDAPPAGAVHRKPTEQEAAVPVPAGYPLAKWADPDVRGVEWPLAVDPAIRDQYTEADQHIDHATEPGYNVDVAPGAQWPALSVRVCTGLPGAFQDLGITEGFGKGEYHQYRQTPALLDHHARFRWIAGAQERANNTLIECTCQTCGTTWQELPAFRTTTCGNCRAAFDLLHRWPGLAHLLRNTDVILGHIGR